MEIIKILKDYSRSPLESKMSEYLSGKLDSAICIEPIKNKKFMIEYIKPINDFVIYTTALSYNDLKRIST